MADGNRLQHFRIEQAEDGGVRADAHREGNHSSSGESGVLPQHAQAIADVLPHAVHWATSALAMGPSRLPAMDETLLPGHTSLSKYSKSREKFRPIHNSGRAGVYLNRIRSTASH